jgi:hypothetical protein
VQVKPFFLFFLFLFFSFCNSANAYTIVNFPTGTISFGTVASPFNTLTYTNQTLCANMALGEAATYTITGTSLGGGSSAFQFTNTTNTAYKLAYTVAWASSNTSYTYVTLTPSVPSSSFGGGALLCIAGVSVNAYLRIQILSANQMLAKQGTYTDTLTIIINST